mmetsp:Transcript_15604/g.35769  ORF Transcript_15604/g.35769 Transcript_15604/m.35769 type:complete len:372 (+) Transcript_15604:1-1116(+)
MRSAMRCPVVVVTVVVLQLTTRCIAFVGDLRHGIHAVSPSSVRLSAESLAKEKTVSTNAVVKTTLPSGSEEGAESSPKTSLRLNVNEKARTVTSVCTSGTLCTVSNHEGLEGAPFGSYVDYVLDERGFPVLLMNDMSVHTINVRENAKKNADKHFVTLFTQYGGDPVGQDVSRCSMTGKLTPIEENAPDMDAIRMKYSITHSYADQVMDSPFFSFYRLVPEKIYFVGGFGVLAKWMDREEYEMAAPDILAREAGEIVKKINREHDEDLRLTATHLLDVKTEIEKIRITNVDRLGMDIRVTSQKGGRRNKLLTDEFRVGFRIPVLSVEDAKSEILKVFQEAWEKGKGYVWENDEELPGSNVPIAKIAADSLE